MSKNKIVRLDIIDEENWENRILDSFYLVNPDKEKIRELKEMIEHRFEFLADDSLSDEEREEAEKFCDNIWDRVNQYIEDNFETINVEECIEIDY